LAKALIYVIARPAWIYRAANHKKGFFMKNLYKFLGIAALAMAIVFSFAACNNSTSAAGDPTSITYTSTDGINTYDLKVSKAGRAAYTPEGGDDYVLKVYPGTTANGTEIGKSTGTITGSGSEFTLNGTGTNGNKVTISDGKMTAIEGSITITKKDGKTTTYSPGTSLSRVTPGGGGANTEPKTLVIIDFPADKEDEYFLYKTGGDFWEAGNVLLYPPGTEWQKVRQTAWNINAYYNIEKIFNANNPQTGTYIIPLMTSDWKEWRGNGTYDIAVLSARNSKDDLDAKTVFALFGVTFSGKETRVAWSDFYQVK
jgi:hypothetical protein